MGEQTASFGGLRVAAMESRRAEEMARLIERLGGRPSVSPSMREEPLPRNPEAVDFAQRVITGQIDAIVFMTGVGIKHLVGQIEKHVDKTRFLEAVSDVVTIARGPKPTAVLKDLGITPTHRVGEPNTWREILSLVDQSQPVLNLSVGLLEYGEPNASLIAGLEARGARVLNVKVYNWELPIDTRPLAANIRAIAGGHLDMVLFTSGHQVANMLRMAEQIRLTRELRAGLDKCLIGSIGPTTSESLVENGFTVGFAPEHSRMGQLVVAAAEQAAAILEKKYGKTAALQILAPDAAAGEERELPPDLSRTADLPVEVRNGAGRQPRAIFAAADQSGEVPSDFDVVRDSLFLRACRREPVERTPIWLMRQAGRYMSEYREVRAKTSFLELCRNSDLCAEVMVTAVNRLGVDAAIIFSDLLPILQPMGLDLEFAQGEGPVIHNPVRTAHDVDRVRELEDVGPLDFVMQTVRKTRAGLPRHPIIGFAGAPFTLASYIIEGGASRSYMHTKLLMYRDPGAWDALMSVLARSVTRYLNAQIAAGAHAVQLFDSWVGCLGPEDYRRYALPYTKAIIDGLTPGAATINFATGNPALLPLLAEAGGQVVGVDWRIELDTAWKTIGHDRAVQGNLDPLVLLSDRDEIRRRADRVLKQAGGRPGHIFNLGHGILPQTPVDNVIALVDAVHELSAR